MSANAITFELVKRGTAKGRIWKKYLDFGWICKYRISKAACIDWDLGNKSKYVVIALNPKGTVVGALKFEFDRRTKKLSSVGTWVRKPERKFGIGRGLWEVAVKELGVKRAKVTVVSDRGLTLVTSFMRAFPDVIFEIQEEADRKLRVLKKAA